MLYTMFCVLILTSLFVLSLEIFYGYGLSSFFKSLLAINLLFVPIGTLFIGLRPVLNLFIVPDTLYKGEDGNLYVGNGRELEISNIKEVRIREKGRATYHLYFYEIKLKRNKQLTKGKRKSLIVTEPYNVRYWNDKRIDFPKFLLEMGLSENCIKTHDKMLKYRLGIREAFDNED